ncbi:hypothetical protein [uncultured Maribacter sp.]|uniref:hypothetical protein n=1 Tax=uncultured Maribacter sp. TaxID=431308 RepID=UPI0026133B3F|nr:hypothetical protein [uncultured Maribacter sp.]
MKYILLLFCSNLIFCQKISTKNVIENEINIKNFFSEESSIHGGYQTNSLYIDSDNFFFCKEENKNTNIYLFYNKKEIKVTDFKNIDIYKDVNHFGLTLILNNKLKKLFFANNNTIYVVDFSQIEKMKAECIFEVPKKYTLWAPLHITNEGDFLSFTLSIGKISFLARLNILSEELLLKKSPFVGTEKPTANHVQICPWDSNIIMFAHEGSWVQDRVWKWNIEKDTLFNVWQSNKYVEVGHEFFDKMGQDENDIFLIQYGSPARKILSGLLQYKEELKEFVPLFYTNEFYVSHASNFKNLVVLDTYRKTFKKTNWILIYDINADKLYRVCPVKVFNHPAHPHPYFNVDGSKIIFNHYNSEKNKIELREIEVNKILKEKNIIRTQK